MPRTKLTFGFYSPWELVTLVVHDHAAAHAPDLVIIAGGANGSSSQPWRVPYDPRRRLWRTQLRAGRHLLRIDVPDDAWFDAGLHVAVLDGEDATFVGHGPADAAGIRRPVAWRAITASSPAGDHWPTPGAPVALDDDLATWFDAALRDAHQPLDVAEIALGAPPRRKRRTTRPRRGTRGGGPAA